MDLYCDVGNSSPHGEFYCHNPTGTPQRDWHEMLFDPWLKRIDEPIE